MNRFTTRTTSLLVSMLVIAATLGVTTAPAQARSSHANGSSHGNPNGKGPGNGSANGACAGVPAKQQCFGTLNPVVDLVAKTLGGFAVNKGAGFIFKRIGLADWLEPDPTQEKLDAISGQLAQVSTQLVTVQDSVNQISRDLAQLTLNDAYNNIKNPIANTQYVYNYTFLPVFNAAVAVQAAKPADRAPLLDVLDRKKNDFLAAFNLYQIGSASTLIHDALTPSGVSTSIVDAYGRVLMANNRFATVTQSNTLAALYTVFAEQEALAVWMKAEYTAAINPDLVETLINTEVIGWPAYERKSMPPAIPNDAVIDLGLNSATITGTTKRPMWVPQRQAATSGSTPNFSWRVGDTTSVNGVEQALVRLNTTAPGTFTDWRAPTRAEVTALFSAFVRGRAPSLDTFNPAWQNYNQFQSFLWTSDLVNQQVECGRQVEPFGASIRVWTRTYGTHVGLWLNNEQPTNYNELVWAPFPKLDARATLWNANIPQTAAYKNCDTYAQNALGGGRGALLATRDTGNVEYFAQHLPPPGTPNGPPVDLPPGGPTGASHGHGNGGHQNGDGHDNRDGGPGRSGRRG